ncbi:MAG: 23S rRNA (guanosine(2251)-2'-O)-methyltransferase RlmB [Bacteroidia bacterium]|nr:23S rRNA (guanosine(2251)-2'-O)-methyltransferase RlmB [Bacteroidia bacterium]
MIVKNQDREKSGNLIYGIHAVAEAAGAGKKFERIFIQNGLKGENIRDLKLLLKERDLEYQYVPAEKVSRLAPGRNHQGVAAFLSAVEYASLADVIANAFERGETPLVLVLDRITDVRNFGAVCRTAECSGVHAVVIPAKGGAMVGPDAIKTSAGALNRITVCKEDHLVNALRYMKNSGLRIVSCTEKTNDLMFGRDLQGPLAVIMGSEEDGISDELLTMSDDKIRIPMAGKIGSLNVSVAAGIVLYEVVRQRLGG